MRRNRGFFSIQQKIVLPLILVMLPLLCLGYWGLNKLVLSTAHQALRIRVESLVSSVLIATETIESKATLARFISHTSAERDVIEFFLIAGDTFDVVVGNKAFLVGKTLEHLPKETQSLILKANSLKSFVDSEDRNSNWLSFVIPVKRERYSQPAIEFTNGFAFIKMSTKDIYMVANRMAVYVALFGLLLMTIVGAVLFWNTRVVIINPLNKTNSIIARKNIDPFERIPEQQWPDIQGRDEIQLLATTLKDLYENVDAHAEELRMEKDFIENLLDTAPVIILCLDPEGRIIRFNSYMEEISGYKLTEVLLSDWTTTFLSTQQREMIDKSPVGDQVISKTISIMTKNGMEIPIEWHDKTIKDGNNNVIGLLSIGRDISERIRVENELLRAKQHAEKVSFAKSKFLATMSHDLRTPLNAVIGFSELLLLDDPVQSLSKKQKENVKQIAGAGRHLLNLVEGLLNLAAIESGKIVLKRELLDLKVILEEFSKTHEVLAARAGIRWSSDIIMTKNIFVDRHRILEVLNNLVSNAIKFTPPMGSITLGARESESELAIFVKDTGVGIDRSHFERIFLPYEQGDQSDIYHMGKSVGLGLAISRQLVELHGGKLTVDSIRGEGSCFTLILPYEVEGLSMGDQRRYDC